MTVILLLLATSLIGTIGLHFCTPRPRAQENWAILAVAPIMVLCMYALVEGAWHG